jgi:hypothetical protein
MLEAKAENSNRYFFHVEQVKGIERGRRAYVVGRKGTGKTAISQYLLESANQTTRFCEKLSFKNFPFNELYRLKNEGFAFQNQYITLWKYLILSAICKLMSKNPAVRAEVRVPLARLFNPDPLDDLARWVSKCTSDNFDLKSVQPDGATGTTAHGAESAWIDRVTTLEKIVYGNVDTAEYFILFDELDEDYRDAARASEGHEYYKALLTGLFKAVQDVKTSMQARRLNVRPVVFLRDDIYSLLGDPDKTKWDDYKIELEWNRESLRKVLAFRISRAISPQMKPLSFLDAWNSIFLTHHIVAGGGNGKGVHIFDYITRSTLMRPRDYIRFISNCATLAASAERPTKISGKVVKGVDKAFSNYLRSELVDEIRGAIPDIEDILDVLSQIRKQTFSVDEFRAQYTLLCKQRHFSEQDPDFVLKILFLFSVVGNQPKQTNQVVFKYANKEANLNYSEKIVVHRGLFKSLQIM